LFLLFISQITPILHVIIEAGIDKDRGGVGIEIQGYDGVLGEGGGEIGEV
jgi:hypothetical protein